jgi:ribosome-associated protein
MISCHSIQKVGKKEVSQPGASSLGTGSGIISGYGVEGMSTEKCVINPSVSIPHSELRFTFSRSSGKGGQHVNKVNSKATLWFDVQASQSLTPEQKALIQERLGSRINRHGVLLIDADRRRSQGANREDALARFAALLRGALHVDKARRKTRPTRASKKRRLQAKKHRSLLKKQRGRKDFD